jgi:hypothetical protein
MSVAQKSGSQHGKAEGQEGDDLERELNSHHYYMEEKRRCRRRF